jgi:hypothetical protein
LSCYHARLCVGIEATRWMVWFVNPVEELGIECQVGRSYNAFIRHVGVDYFPVRRDPATITKASRMAVSRLSTARMWPDGSRLAGAVRATSANCCNSKTAVTLGGEVAMSVVLSVTQYGF